jgi:hypothetical protein
MNRKPGVRRTATATPGRQPPWRTDVQATRETALSEARPCVIILNADSGAL